MSVVQVYTDAGRLDQPKRDRLVEALTKAVADVEVGNDNPVVRTGIMVLFHEMPRGTWAVGGVMGDAFVGSGGRVLLLMHAMQGVWTPVWRGDLIQRFSRSVCEVLGIRPDDRRAQSTCWVVFNEVPDGSWGAMGGPLSLLSILEPAKFTADRQADARAAIQTKP